jgi:hypothetical protein
VILAQTIGEGTGLQVSYSFGAAPDKAAIEAKMNQAYQATFDQLGDQFKYVEIAAYPPGSTIDAVGVKFPTYDTSIGSNEVQAGEDPSGYWRVESWTTTGSPVARPSPGGLPESGRTGSRAARACRRCDGPVPDPSAHT